MPELPQAMAQRFAQVDGLSADAAQLMTQSLGFARYYEAARDACTALLALAPGDARADASGVPKLVANWLAGELSKRLNAEGQEIAQAPVAPATLAALIGRIVDGTISHNAARQVFDALWSAEAPGGASVDALIEAKGLKQMRDSNALEAIIDQVLAANPKSVDEYRAGKEKAFNALVGQVMKASKGQANPAQAHSLLKQKLG
jgi:aspartyl-tRNA(Asn)/glutamyl-tRNA(Gln) amidotransferase subunit B